jgi:1-acyl-sn-glycerol-3-phosphate acyltransferase
MEDDKFLQGCLRVTQALMAYHRYEARGLEYVPPRGPALIAVSHSLATYDSFLLGTAIYEVTGRLAAGLADRRIFQTPGLAQLFTRLGAVEGTPKSGERLLGEGNLLMLAPGGMRESLRPTSQRYRVSWEGRLGFARLAIRAQVPVILAACPAADDIYRVYANPVTSLVYRKLKWPLPMARGLGLTLIPRPVRLIHFLNPPMQPPALRDGKPDEGDVHAFQKQLSVEMQKLMRCRPV